MRVKWSPFAREQMHEVARYIRWEFGLTRRDEFMQEVREANRLIGHTPNIGKIEPLLEDEAITYRSYVLNRLNKIIYYIENDHVEIADFWDVRRDPGALADRIK